MTGEAPELNPTYLQRLAKEAAERNHFTRLSKVAAQMAAPALVDWEKQGVPDYASTKSTGFWSGVNAVVSSFGDLKTRLIGRQLFPDDPKYQFGPAGSPEYLSTANLLIDSGFDDPIGKLNEASSLAGDTTPGGFPFLAMLAGLAIDIADPTDPLNKIRPFGKTKLGKVAHLMDQPGFRQVVKNQGGRWVVDHTAMESVVTAAKDRIKHSGLPKNDLREARAIIKTTDRLRRDRKQVEAALQSVVKAGMDPAKLTMQGKSIYQQTREGYRKALGFTHPTSMDHVPFLGASELAMDDTVGSVVSLGLGSKALRGAGVPGVSRVLDVGAGATISALGAGIKGAKNLVARVADKMGWAPRAMSQAANDVIAAIKDISGDSKVYTTEWMDRAQGKIREIQIKHNIPDELMPEVFASAKIRKAFEEIELSGNPRRVAGDQRLAGAPFPDVIRAIQDGHAARAASAPFRMKKGVFAGRDLEAGMEELGPAASEEQRSWILSGRPTDEEALEGSASFAKAQVGKVNVGEFERLHDSKLVVLGSEPSVIRSAAKVLENVKNPENIIGLNGMRAVFPNTKLMVGGREVRAGAAPVIVARKIAGGQPVKVAREVGAGIPLDATHIENLELTAAALADQGLALVGLTADDLLVNTSGGAQITNPLRIVPVRSPSAQETLRFARGQGALGVRKAISGLKGQHAAKEGAKKMMAARASEATLRKLMAMAAEVDNPGRQFTHLRNPGSIAAAAKLGRKLAVTKRGSRVAADALAEGQKIGFVAPAQLLEEQQNLLHHKIYVNGGKAPGSEAYIARLLGFPLAQSVESKRAQIRAAQMAGSIPEIPPIHVSKDRFGNLYINEGGDWALAAALEDVATVPITAAPFTGQTLDAAGAVVRPLSHFGEYFAESSNELAASRTPELYTDYGLVAQSYKAHSGRGLHTPKVPAGSQKLTQEQYQDVYNLSNGISKVLGMGPHGRSPVLANNISNHLLHHRDGAYVAAARAAHAVVQAKSWEEFGRAFSEIVGDDLVTHLLQRPQLRNHLDEEFATKLRAEALIFLDRLAQQGVFSDAMLQEDRFLRQFDGIIESYDRDSEVYSLAAANRSVEDLREFARQRIATTGPGAEHMRPEQLVVLRGQDATDSFRVADLVAPELLQKTRIKSSAPLQLTPEQIKDYEVNKRILVNPTREVLERNGLDPFGRILNRKEAAVGAASTERPAWGLFVTEHGDVIMGMRPEHESAESFLTELFGAGFIPPGEFGFIDWEKVTLNYPVVGTMTRLDRGTIAALQSRIRFVAKKLIDSGINERTPMHVTMPFDKGHWDAIFGTPALKTVASPGFKLNVPKHLIGSPLDVSMDTVQWVVRYHRPRGANPQIDELMDWIISENVEADRNELLNGITKGAFSGYMHRKVTEGGARAIQHAMNRAAEQMAKLGDKREVKKASAFLKQKVFTDLTTSEMNAFIKAAREGQAYTKEQIKERLAANSALSWVWRQLITDETAEKLGEIVRAMDEIELPIEHPLWVEDPIIALGSRVIQSQREIRVKRSMDRLAEIPGVVAVMTREEMAAADAGRAEVAQLLQKKKKLTDDVAGFDRRIAEIDAGKDRTAHVEGEYSGLVLAKKKADDELGQLAKQIQARQEELTAQHGLGYTLGSPKGGRVYVDTTAVEKLLADGTLSEADLASRWDLGDITALRADTVIDKLGPTERMFIFSEEMAPVVEKYFSVQRDPAALARFLKGYDQAMGIWKAWTLFPIVAYHSRNILSSFFQYWLGDGRADAIGDSLEIMNLVSKGRNGKAVEVEEALAQLTILDDYGNVTTGKELYNKWIHHGGPQGFHVTEFGPDGVPKEKWRQFVKKVTNDTGILPASEAAGPIMLDNPIIRPGKRFAEWTENRFRLAAFIDGWKRTGDFEQASLNMKKIFYDYEDLSAFERQWVRRFVPFYSFSRSNIPRMIETIVTRPEQHLRFQRMVNSFQTGVTDGMPVEEDITNWMGDQFNVVVNKAKDGSYWVRSLEYTFPAYEMYALFSKPGDVLIGGVTPFLKIPVELMLGKQFYGAKTNALGTEVMRDIKTFDNEPARSELLSAMGFTKAPEIGGGPLGPLNILANEYLFGQLFRVGKNMTRTIDWFLTEENNRKFPGVVAAGLDMLFGRAYNMDPVRARMYFMRDYRSNLQRINGLIRMHQERGNADAVTVLNNLRANLTLQYQGEK